MRVCVCLFDHIPIVCCGQENENKRGIHISKKSFAFQSVIYVLYYICICNWFETMKYRLNLENKVQYVGVSLVVSVFTQTSSSYMYLLVTNHMTWGAWQWSGLWSWVLLYTCTCSFPLTRYVFIHCLLMHMFKTIA